MSNRRMISRSLKVAPAIALSSVSTRVLAANSGTPLDAVYTSATAMVSGPMAGLVILFGALAVAVYFMFARGLEGGGLSHAVGWLIGGCIVAAIVTFMPLFFPAAGALIN
jgi:type IV secretory pathway VirB2 component (pilin)